MICYCTQSCAVNVVAVEIRESVYFCVCSNWHVADLTN